MTDFDKSPSPPPPPEERPGQAQPSLNITPRARAPMPPPPSSSGTLWRVLIVLFLIGGLTLSMCLNLALIAGSGSSNTNGPPGSNLMERTYKVGESTDRLLMIRVEGAIIDGATSLLSGPSPSIVKYVRDSLTRATTDESIKGVVLRVDSPGGGVTESDEIYDFIVDFKNKTKKPVVVSMGGICASGGYYISAPADKIFAQQTTITGSIGVILSGYNYHKLMEKVGISDITIASADNKALLSASRPPNPEHIAILQKTVDSMYERFVSIVSQGRGLSVDEIKEKKIADGRVFTVEEAQSLKLIDRIGYLDDAIDEARKLSKAPGAWVIELVRPANLFSLFGAHAEHPVSKLDPERLLNKGPRYLYMWKP